MREDIGERREATTIFTVAGAAMRAGFRVEEGRLLAGARPLKAHPHAIAQALLHPLGEGVVLGGQHQSHRRGPGFNLLQHGTHHGGDKCVQFHGHKPCSSESYALRTPVLKGNLF